MKILLIILLIYTVSFLRMYIYIRNCYSIGGIYEGKIPGRFERGIIHIPILNTIAALVSFLESKNGKKLNNTDPNKFLNLRL